MECELNPRIPYTELSHIIKKQKEVWPRGGQVSTASLLLKAGERCGAVLALRADLQGSKGALLTLLTREWC